MGNEFPRLIVRHPRYQKYDTLRSVILQRMIEEASNEPVSVAEADRRARAEMERNTVNLKPARTLDI